MKLVEKMTNDKNERKWHMKEKKNKNEKKTSLNQLSSTTIPCGHPLQRMHMPFIELARVGVSQEFSGLAQIHHLQFYSLHEQVFDNNNV